MEIIRTENGDAITLSVSGRLDTNTAAAAEKQILEAVAQTGNLQLDFSKLEYLSSAGLRTLLTTQKLMSKKGKLTLSNVNKEVMFILEVSGFKDILTII